MTTDRRAARPGRLRDSVLTVALVPTAVAAAMCTFAAVSGVFEQPSAAAAEYVAPTPPPPVTASAEPPPVAPSRATTVAGGEPAAYRRGFQPTDTSGLGVADIPTAALVAYQRAAAVLDDSAADCGLDWTLLAAVGQVESGHGRTGSSALDPDGVARPGIYGRALDGTDHRSKVADTDAGAVDGDPRWDRPVGPMQILPSIWAALGVDADGDGDRDPQDVDDAALAVALALCTDHADLSDPAGARRALLAYNDTEGYAAQVLAAASAYAASEDQQVADSSAPTLVREPAPSPSSTPSAPEPSKEPDQEPSKEPTFQASR